MYVINLSSRFKKIKETPSMWGLNSKQNMPIKLYSVSALAKQNKNNVDD